MPYSAQISRTNPACILLLIDQSGSMEQPFAERPDESKAAVVAEAVNSLLRNLVLRSAKAEGVRDYFHVGVIGYGMKVAAKLGGKMPDHVLIPISRLADKPLRVEKRTRLVRDDLGAPVEQTAKFPVWFDPEARGKTPMVEAFADAADAVDRFIGTYPDAYPPIVLNLTDGHSTDGNPQSNARTIRAMATADGNALVFNLLMTGEPTLPTYFLHDEGLIADLYSKLLFRMSSELPEPMFRAARAEGFAVEPKARGVVFNADPTAIVRFLDIGTRVGPVSAR